MLKKIKEKSGVIYYFIFVLSFLFLFSITAEAQNDSPGKKPIQKLKIKNIKNADKPITATRVKSAKKKTVRSKNTKAHNSPQKSKSSKNSKRYSSYPSSSNITKEEDYITLDFKGEIKDLIKMFSELMGKNVIYDETFRDKITIIAPKKLSKEEAWNIFLSVLDYRGYNIVESKEAIRIVKAQSARQKAIETLFKDEEGKLSDTSKLVTYVTHLKYAEANQIRSALGQLISPRTGNISVYAPTNTLIITDTEENIKRLLKIIDAIDVAGLEERPIISVIPLENASAKTLAAELREILQGSLSFSAGGTKTPKPPQSAGGSLKGVKIIPDERLNALVIVATLEITTQIEDLIKKLDAPIEKGSSKVNVYYLNNAVAEDVKNALMGIIKNRPSIGKPPVGRPGGVQPTAPLFGNDVIISADKSTNSLIISASPEDYQLLKKIIAKLDIMKPQVFIEALLIEVSQSKLVQLGVDLNFLQKLETIENNNIRAIGLSNISGSLAQLIASSATGGAGIPGLSPGGTVAITKGTIKLADGTEVLNIGALATAFASQSGINVIAQPQIITMDNEEAKILVGENRRFIKSSTIVADTANTVNTFEFRDVALQLTITPHINKEGFVRMEIEQTVENVIPGSGASEQGVETNKREAKTTAVARDQETIVIGGLIRETNTPGIDKVPCLGDIPLLGWFFSKRTNTKEKTNLLIFLKPTIVDTPAQLAKLTAKKKDVAKKAQEENEKSKDIIYRTIIDGNYKFWKKEKKEIPLLDEESPILKKERLEAEKKANKDMNEEKLSDESLKNDEVEIDSENDYRNKRNEIPVSNKPIPQAPED
ncbi:MAG: type II secretion system protein GspD [Candidatus Schekmanbacteria bacterium]|nr:MAG: type II secretion system protein GspD [Candidatus Schekmanbacteria bacterium]